MARRLGEAASVAAWDGRRIVCVATDGRPSSVEMPERGPGVRLPGHSTGLGKVLLAHRPWEEVEERAAVDGLPVFTPHTVDTIDRLRHQLQEARVRTVAFDHQENYAGVSCIAAPVRDASSRVVAALSFSMPTAKLRHAEPHFERAVRVASHRLTTMLGGGASAARLTA
jgi:DNA-binding IclR family transcriptional regulator